MSNKESLEMLKLLQVATEQLKAAKADGAINLWDVPKLAPVIPAFLSAVKDANLIPSEIKGYSEEELKEVLVAVVNNVVALLDAVFEIPLESK